MLNTEFKIPNYQFVTVQADVSQNRYYFPDLPNLRDVLTVKIVSYNDRNFRDDINNIPVVDIDVYRNSTFTLYSKGSEFLQKIDLMLFNTISTQNLYCNQNGTVGLKPIEIDFSKSYIENLGTVPALGYPYSYCFGIYYFKK
jgi:hypothetical protein